MRTVILKLGGYLCDTVEESGEDGRTQIRRKLYLLTFLSCPMQRGLGIRYQARLPFYHCVLDRPSSRVPIPRY